MNEKLEDEIKEVRAKFNGGYFNWRIVEKIYNWTSKKNNNYFEKSFEIYEIYYNENNEIIAWTENPRSLLFNDLADLKDLIKHIKKATKHTVLTFKDENTLVDTGKYLKQYKEKDLTNFDFYKEYPDFYC